MAVVALEVGLLLGIGVFAVVGSIALVYPRLAFLSGTLIGQGGTLVALMLAADPQRNASLTFPLEVIGAALLVVGLILGLITAAQTLRR